MVAITLKLAPFAPDPSFSWSLIICWKWSHFAFRLCGGEESVIVWPMAVTESLKLPEHFNLEPELREQLGSRAGHQRCIEGSGELLLVVHDVPRHGSPHRETLFFWKCREGSWLQTAGPSLGSGTGLSGLVGLLDRYQETLDGHHEALAKAAAAAEILAILRHAGPLARTSRNLLQTLEHTLTIDQDDRTIRNCRDHAREIERAADLLLTDARVSLEFRQAAQLELLARTTAKLQHRVFRLLLLVGIFLPLTAFGAWFGMVAAPPVNPWLRGILLAAAVLGGLGICLGGRRRGGDP